MDFGEKGIELKLAEIWKKGSDASLFGFFTSAVEHFNTSHSNVHMSASDNPPSQKNCLTSMAPPKGNKKHNFFVNSPYDKK